MLSGCGSRGPLDDTPAATLADASPPIVDGAVDTDAGDDAAAPEDASREASTVACGACVLTTCGQTIFACLQDEACRTVFQCVATTCLAGGDGANPTCIFGCASGNPAGALGVLGVFQCVSRDCGGDCGPLLAGLGNLPGGGSGFSSADERASAATPRVPVDREAFAEVFSRWPALLTPVTTRAPSRLRTDSFR